MNRLRVYVVDRGRRGLCFRWKVEGRWKEKKCEHKRRSAAERAAVEFAVELERRANGVEHISWSAFCTQYEDEHVDRTSVGNQCKWRCVRKRFQAYLDERGNGQMPMTELSPRLVSGFRSQLIKDLPSEASAASYFATFRAGINYAAEREICPPIPTLRRRGHKSDTQPKMRGRAVSEKEFRRMLDATAQVVGEDRSAEFRKALSMMWFGGLRRSEVLMFHTHRLDCHRVSALHTNAPVAVFYQSQKNKKNQEVAMVEDWAEYLRSIEMPPGWICSPLNDRGWRIANPTELGRFVKKIGIAAKVAVVPAMDGEPPKYATAQNLRQGFGYRWAPRVMPATLMHLMRHADIKTTMQFYAGVDAQAAATALEQRARTSDLAKVERISL